MQKIQGSLRPIFESKKSGQMRLGETMLFSAKSVMTTAAQVILVIPFALSSRDGYFYSFAFKPERWPGCPPETGYLQVDGSPTKTEVLEHRRSGADKRFWELCFGKRQEEALYDLKKDVDCVNNLAGHPSGYKNWLRNEN